jgi:hypothetical protein
MACRPFNAVAIMMTAGILIGGLASARATTLLNLEDPTAQTNHLFDLTFTAGSASTVITFQGYQVPAHEQTTHIGLFLNGTGPNLLGGSWVFTGAPSSSDADTFDDGTSVPALNFAAGDEDSYDMFAQTIATSVGGVYTLDFLFSNSTNNQPSGLIIDASDANVSNTPIPGTLPLFASVFGAGLLAMWRKRRRDALATA